jgi:hypothetical protein
MFQAYAVHYKNKFPKSQVKFDDNSLDVYSVDGKHLVAVRKTGAGSIKDASKELGCFECHDLSPIPKMTRAYKLYADGNIGMAEEYRERRDYVIDECSKAIDGKSLVVENCSWGGFKVKSEK